MQTVTFDVETLTPLFLAGADQTKAELRAPSFRGLMRYWLRALVGSVVGTDTQRLEEVMGAEKELFGATDIGSAVSVRVKGLEDLNHTEEFKRSGRGWNITGKDYLLWSMAQFGEKPLRSYFPTGVQFEVTLATQGQGSRNLEKAVAAFWLLVNLGGVGSRSRRCAGSLIVRAVKGNTIDLQFAQPTSSTTITEAIDSLSKRLEQSIKIARRLYGISSINMRDAKFDVLSPRSCSIWILYDKNQPWRTVDAAMNSIGSSLQRYRREEILPLRRRKIFGLPLKGVSGKRRASPLLLRITELQMQTGKQYVGIAVLFKTTGKNPLGEDVSVQDYDLIEKWFDTFSGKKKVTL